MLKHITANMKKLDDEIDDLFRLPLAEFISARKALAARLKSERRGGEADRVKSLPKPSISVWAVNQLYWRHRDQFDRLIAAGQRFRRAHSSRTGKAEEMNEALHARREALSHLSDLAARLLSDAGHNPALETMRRIGTTMEAISAYAALPDDQAAGRLTKDLDPPGFESLAPFIRAVPTQSTNVAARISPATKSVPPAKTRQNSTAIKEGQRIADTRQTRLAAAKATLQNARRSLLEARTKAKALEAEQKKAVAEAKNAENQKHEAERHFKDASTAAAAASVRAQNITLEAERAAKTLADAERAVAQASKHLESRNK